MHLYNTVINMSSRIGVTATVESERHSM